MFLSSPTLIGQSPSSSVRQRSPGSPIPDSYPDLTFAEPSFLPCLEPSALTFSPEEEKIHLCSTHTPFPPKRPCPSSSGPFPSQVGRGGLWAGRQEMDHGHLPPQPKGKCQTCGAELGDRRGKMTETFRIRGASTSQLTSLSILSPSFPPPPRSQSSVPTRDETPYSPALPP